MMEVGLHDLRRLRLEKVTGGHWLVEPPTRPITGAAIDTRRLRPNQLFVAIRTNRDDGHRYLEKALHAGAAAALVQEPRPQIPLAQLCVANPILALQQIATAHRSTLSCPIIAVVGSYGKTTVKDLLATMLGREACYATEGNLNNTIGVPLSLLEIHADDHRYAVIEAGISKPGEMATIASILSPQHVIFTSLSHKHGEFFSSQRHLLEEKLRIVSKLDGTLVITSALAEDPALVPLRCRMVCVDDLSHSSLAPPTVPRLFFSRKNCTIAIRRSKEATLRHFSLPRPSDGFAQNFALCYAMAQILGISDDVIADRLVQWQWPNLRGQILYNPVRGCVYYVDCYNSDMPSLVDASRTFARLFPHGPRLLVIGSMSEFGARSGALHWEAGMALIFLPADRFFLLGQEIRPLRSALRSRFVPAENISYFDSKEELQRALDPFRGTVFFKGSRLHAMETLVNSDGCLPII